MKGKPGFDFSFSGLKTAVRQTAEELGELSGQDKADIAASFQAAAADALVSRTKKAMGHFSETQTPKTPSLVVAGGVAANQTIRSRLNTLCNEERFTLVVPPPRLCTDNGVMIGWAGLERLSASGQSGRMGALDAPPRARWPLSTA